MSNPKFYFVSVGFDAYDKAVCQAYVGPTWNGFAVPMVDKDNLDLFLAFLPKLKADGVDLSDDVKRLKSEVITFQGKQIMVWNIGFGLMWQVEASPDSEIELEQVLNEESGHMVWHWSVPALGLGGYCGTRSDAISDAKLCIGMQCPKIESL